MKLKLALISGTLLVLSGCQQAGVDQACPPGCQSRIDEINGTVQNLSGTTAKVSTFKLTSSPQEGGAKAVSGTHPLGDIWRNTVLVHVAVGGSVASFPFRGNSVPEIVTTLGTLDANCPSGGRQEKLTFSFGGGALAVTRQDNLCPAIDVDVTLLLDK